MRSNLIDLIFGGLFILLAVVAVFFALAFALAALPIAMGFLLFAVLCGGVSATILSSVRVTPRQRAYHWCRYIENRSGVPMPMELRHKILRGYLTNSGRVWESEEERKQFFAFFGDYPQVLLTTIDDDGTVKYHWSPSTDEHGQGRIIGP